MYWQETQEHKSDYRVPDDIIDVLFSIECKTLPLEHAYALSNALHGALPWLAQEEAVGIHPIYVAESGNGWMRPQDPEHDLLHLSKRTKLILRIPRRRLADAQALCGKTLSIAGHSLRVGKAATRLLSTLTTLFSRSVPSADGCVENTFLENQYTALTTELHIHVKKMLCGKEHLIQGPQGPICARSLLLAELTVDESVRLQQQGLGPGRKMGLGLFIPHKSIHAVKEIDAG